MKYGMGYTPLWIVNMCLATIAAAASYMIKMIKRSKKIEGEEHS
ncbi:MAG: hypothetical protein ACI4UH_02450 [Dorea sp.]